MLSSGYVAESVVHTVNRKVESLGSDVSLGVLIANEDELSGLYGHVAMVSTRSEARNMIRLDRQERPTQSIRLDLASAEIDPSTGWMTVTGTATLVGVLQYPHGGELVPAETLADTSGLVGLPVTVQHRKDGSLLDIDTTSDEQVGTVIEAKFDGDKVRVRMRITDRAGIAALQAGTHELSPGYDTEIERRSGVFDGKPFVAVQTKRRYNHIALVDRARGGREARVDAMATISINGTDYEVDEAVAAHIKSLSSSDEPSMDAAQTPMEPARTDSLDVAALTASITKSVIESVATVIRTDRETVKREAVELADAIAVCRPHLPQSYRTDGKDRGQIYADAILAIKPDMAAIVKEKSSRVDWLEGTLTGLVNSTPAESRTDGATAEELGGGEPIDMVEAARRRQSERLDGAAKKGAK